VPPNSEEVNRTVQTRKESQLSDLPNQQAASSPMELGAWQVVTNEEAFLDLRNEWEQLFASNHLHSPFLTWGWVNAWLRYRAGPHRLKVLVNRDGRGRVQFIFPMIQRKTANPLRNRRLTLVCSYGSEASDYLGCLRTPAFNSQMAEIANDGLQQMFGKRFSLEMAFADNLNDFPEKLESICRANGRATRLINDAVCPTTALPSSWDEYLGTLSSNFRSQIRRFYKRAMTTEGVRFRSIEFSEAEDFVATLTRLNRQRISDKGEVSSLEDENVREFLVPAVAYMAEQGLAWMDVLEQDDEIVGASLHFVHGATAYYYMGGFREDAKHLRPGTTLFAHVIQRCIKRQFEVFDFLRGSDTYKYRWGAADRTTSKLDIYPSTPIVGRAQWAVDECELGIKRFVRRIRSLRSKGAAN